MQMIFKIIIFCFVIWCFITPIDTVKYYGSIYKEFNPCCSMPCINRGVCTPLSFMQYECDCPKGYYGKNCEKSSTLRWLIDLIKLNLFGKQKLLLSGKFIWGVINNIPSLHNIALRYFYISNTDLSNSKNPMWHYQNFDFYYNHSYYKRDLPPVPLECPTPLGTKGPRVLPSVHEVFNAVFRRRDFRPCPFGTNLMFVTFSQYLAYQFFKPEPLYLKNEEFTFYDTDILTKRALRSWKDGKLKTRIINGEEYPPYLEDAPSVQMYYPNKLKNMPVFPKWAMEHKMLSITPLMFALVTILIREHNRVCDIIIKEHPEWTDERIYETARLIVLGELLTITTSEYFQHMSQYRIKLEYKPQLHQSFSSTDSLQMHHEFGLTFQWYHMMPDIFTLLQRQYNMSDIMFSNNRIIFEHGLDAVVDSMSRSPAAQLIFRNCGRAFEDLFKEILEEGRRTRLHSFNNYRKFYGLPPYKTFKDLVGNDEDASILEALYGDIDAVEFLVGAFLEKHSNSVIPPTMLFLTAPALVKEILSNPLGSSNLWRPSTFGGKNGFDIVQKATLRKLFCLNLKGNCKNNVWVSFRTPWDVTSTSKRINQELSEKL